MRLTEKGRASRQRLVEAASLRLRGDAPGAMRLEDVLADAGMSKGQLFHYFPDGKEQLLLAVARYEAERVLADQEPHLSALDSLASWQAWRDVLVARYREQGAHCPLGALLAQAESTVGAGEVVTALLDRWQRHLRDGITAMRAAAGAEADREAAALIAGIQGGVQILRTTRSTAHLEAVLDQFIERLPSGP
ncbi:TetR/AcrR family transcriptional regulator [Glycomyces harbinensis]|uniref:Transcriptional regulator, TetR family n=1 Tax=Glycomyces harbinensis TaxID=58114 RepID=A0A1G6Y178_9ACTN|nr:TetR/AcrR family transcriptional regulator [Glycomyces harbinensis]SDD84042.1 transcriptional regulator, TetR family [Glycomyces harbinensis]